MRIAVVTILAVASIHLVACTGGGGGGGVGDGGAANAADGGTSTGGGAAGGGGGGGGATATIPDVFYGPWAYMHATLYEPGEEPTTTSISGTAVFERDGTYEQSYYIGNVLNHYKGTYVIDAKRLRTNDENGKEVFDFRWSIGNDPKIGAPVLTLFIDDDQGNPSIMYALRATERE